MSTEHGVIAIRKVPVTRETLDMASAPSLNGRVLQIIAQSGVQSLQVFLRPDALAAFRLIARTYWNVEGHQDAGPLH